MKDCVIIQKPQFLSGWGALVLYSDVLSLSLRCHTDTLFHLKNVHSAKETNRHGQLSELNESY